MYIIASVLQLLKVAPVCYEVCGDGAPDQRRASYQAEWGKLMIKHVVFFKFRPETSESERKSALNQLRALPDKIDVIREYEVGEDLLKTSRSWDAVLVSAFDDLDALQTYQRHDDHLPVVMKMQQLCDAVGSVDYEI
jgi:stress responsive alpha/beta barrel protein